MAVLPPGMKAHLVTEARHPVAIMVHHPPHFNEHERPKQTKRIKRHGVVEKASGLPKPWQRALRHLKPEQYAAMPPVDRMGDRLFPNNPMLEARAGAYILGREAARSTSNARQAKRLSRLFPKGPGRDMAATSADQWQAHAMDVADSGMWAKAGYRAERKSALANRALRIENRRAMPGRPEYHKDGSAWHGSWPQDGWTTRNPYTGKIEKRSDIAKYDQAQFAADVKAMRSTPWFVAAENRRKQQMARQAKRVQRAKSKQANAVARAVNQAQEGSRAQQRAAVADALAASRARYTVDQFPLARLADLPRFGRKGKAAAFTAAVAAPYALSPYRRKEGSGKDHARRAAIGAGVGALGAQAAYVGGSYGISQAGAGRWMKQKGPWTSEVARHRMRSGVEPFPDDMVNASRWAREKWHYARRGPVTQSYRTMPLHIPGASASRLAARLYGAGTVGRKALLVSGLGAVAGAAYGGAGALRRKKKERR